MSDADCTPGREQRSVAASLNSLFSLCCRTQSLGYEVQKLPVKGHGDWTPVNAKPISGTTFTVPNLIEGSEFEFRVVAINDAGPGKPSKSTGPHKVRDPICKSRSRLDARPLCAS